MFMSKIYLKHNGVILSNASPVLLVANGQFFIATRQSRDHAMARRGKCRGEVGDMFKNMSNRLRESLRYSQNLAIERFVQEGWVRRRLLTVNHHGNLA